jgi:DNA-binding NarL/FixJ family response regulator
VSPLDLHAPARRPTLQPVVPVVPDGHVLRPARRRQRRGRQVQPLVGREAIVDEAFTRLIEGASVAVLGRRGSGRSRVLQELEQLYTGATLRLTPTPATASLPLEVLRRALPGLGDLADRPLGEARTAVARALRRVAGGRPLLVVIDDAHLLDAVTAAGLREVVDQLSWCVVLCAVPLGTRVPSAARPGWDHPEVVRLHLPPLSGAAVERIAVDELGGRLDLRLAAELRTRAGGSPAAVVELLRGARETGVLAFDGEVWRGSGPLPVHRVATWLAPAVDQLSADGREVAELLATTGPLPELAVAGVAPAAAVGELVGAGYAGWAWGEGARRYLALVDPLEAEAIASGVSGDRRAMLLRCALDAVRRTGTVPAAVPDDRLASWQLELGEAEGPELFARAARDAYGAGEYARAAQLGRVAVARGGGCRSAMAAGAAAIELGEQTEGERLLTAAVAAATDEPERVWSTIALAHARWAGAGRWDEAAALLGTLRERTRDVELRAEVDAYRCLVAAAAGRYDEAIAGLRRGAGGTGGPVVEGSRSALLLGAAAAVLEEDRPGTTEGRDARERVGTAGDEVTPALPLGPSLVRAAALLVATPDEALSGAQEQLELALEGGSDDEPAWWSLVAGRHALRAGRVRRAEAMLGDAVRGFDAVDPLRLRPLALVQLARARAWAGACAAARSALEQLSVDDLTGSPRLAAWAELAEAEILAAADPQAAGGWAADLASRQADGGSLAVAVAAAELAVVVGAGAEVAEVLATLAVADRTGATSALADAAAARVAGRPDHLEAAARKLAGTGRRLLAAAVAVQAGDARGTAVDAVAALARGLLTACTGAALPGRGPVPPVALPPRVRLAARAAAAGVPSAVLAADLGVSVRTVESHLGRAYRTLGVGGRRELARCYPSDLAPLVET